MSFSGQLITGELESYDWQHRDTAELLYLAHKAMVSTVGRRFELCGITNAKSGKCSEDCKFCAQSSRYSTSSPIYPLKDKDTMLMEAGRAREIGADRIGIVTSGRGIGQRDLDVITETVMAVKQDTGMQVCASLGVLDKAALSMLRDAGLTRFHHNIETSRNFYPQVVSTHSFDDRVQTIKAAQEVGLEVCSGGIIGLGEDESDRVSMALTLRDLGVKSVPINILVPIKGTPFANNKPLSVAEILRTIAIFRLILGDKTIKIAAGRETALGDFQGMAFWSGANGMIIGGYLTIDGREAEKDLRLVEEWERLCIG